MVHTFPIFKQLTSDWVFSKRKFDIEVVRRLRYPFVAMFCGDMKRGYIDHVDEIFDWKVIGLTSEVEVSLP